MSDNENIINEIFENDTILKSMLKTDNVDTFIRILDDHYQFLDEIIEQDKQDRKNLKLLFKDIELGLKELREESNPISIEDLPKKNYVKVNIGGKWVTPRPKRLGKLSIIEQFENVEYEEMEE